MTTTTYDAGPPWLTWGNSEQLIITTESGGVSSVQLVNVDFRRPTTWQLYLAVSDVKWDPVSPDMAIQVDFDIQFGVGRALSTLPPVTFIWSDAQLTAGNGVGDNRALTRFQLAAPSPAPGVEPSFIDKIPAQNIVIGARMSPGGAPLGVGRTLTATALAFAAPIDHIRPDWFEGQFLGGELRGR